VLGKLEQKRDLFYVLGVLLGDGYIYHWKSFYSVGILVKNKSFAMKFAEHLSKCIGREVFAYCSKKRMLWFVRIGNFELFTLFKNFRNDLNFKKAIEVMPKEDALQFIEGFFDAEGCVKIIKENIRQTPKVCLDFTNTNREVLEAVKQLLKVFLQVEARFSVQHDKRDNRKTVYHLRIYKKDYVRIFFENVQTIKLSKEKALYLEKWLQHNVTVKL
jgi:intein/homing endonuclease